MANNETYRSDALLSAMTGSNAEKPQTTRYHLLSPYIYGFHGTCATLFCK